MDYPITITAADIEQQDPCEKGLAAFREHYPDGLTVRDAAHHSALLAGPLGMYEVWALDEELLPPIRIMGGYRSTLTGGYRSTLTGGDDSTLTGGNYSTLTGGNYSTLTWRYWDGTHYRLHTVYTGEDGIEAGVAYVGRVVDGKLTVTKKEEA